MTLSPVTLIENYGLALEEVKKSHVERMEKHIEDLGKKTGCYEPNFLKNQKLAIFVLNYMIEMNNKYIHFLNIILSLKNNPYFKKHAAKVYDEIMFNVSQKKAPKDQIEQLLENIKNSSPEFNEACDELKSQFKNIVKASSFLFSVPILAAILTVCICFQVLNPAAMVLMLIGGALLSLGMLGFKLL